MSTSPVWFALGGGFSFRVMCGRVFPESRNFDQMAKGNPNPSPATRFVPGQSGNPGGKSVEVVSIERRNAEAAMRIRERMLQAIERSLVQKDGVTAEDVDKAAMGMVEAAMLKLLTDSETRGLGAPVQPITGGDGGALQITIKRYADD